MLVLANLGTQPVKDLEVAVPASLVVSGVAIMEELQGAAVNQPQAGPGGRLDAWTPLPNLSPRSVYVLHARR